MIKPYGNNQHYWQYRNKPLLLIGGSDRDNLFQWANQGGKLVDHLDTLKACGGNYLRCTMSSREYTSGGYRWDILPYPYQKLSDGRYDLDVWDEEYWGRLQIFLAETHSREIIVQLELWDMWNEAGDSEKVEKRFGWFDSPWNPNNNVNYDWSDSPLLVEGATPFYNPLHLAPIENDSLLVPHQERFVTRVLEVALEYDHVLFQIDNESGIDLDVGLHWARFLHEQAASRGRTVCVCDSRRFRPPCVYDTTVFQDRDNPEIVEIVSRPEAYTFCDISQNNGVLGQEQYDNLMWYRQLVMAHGVRPINNVKCYHFAWPIGIDFKQRTAVTDQQAAAKLWRAIFGGAASLRFHRLTGFAPGGLKEGFGLSPEGQRQLTSMRMFTDFVDLFAMEPHNDLLSDRQEDEAYCLANRGSQYAVFFTGDGDRTVDLDLSGLKGEAEIRWLDADRSAWSGTDTVSGGGKRSLSAPDQRLWTAVVSLL